jgi:hypothetical protein
MTWHAYDGVTINVVQQKTGTKLAIAVQANLRALLDTRPRQAITILVTDMESHSH